MTEREKMAAGLPYNSLDRELVAVRERAHKLIERFNRTEDDETELRTALLDQFLGRAGKALEMTPRVNFDYGFNTFIGDYCYFNYNLTVLDCAEVRFGDNVFVGPNVSFLTPLHPLLPRERNFRFDENGNRRNLEYCRPIRVGNNVWIGGGAIVNPGVTIGDDSVIGSGSVVTRDVPPGVLAAGVPCRPIRNITEADSLERLFPDR